jgi:hypothetical protein
VNRIFFTIPPFLLVLLLVVGCTSQADVVPTVVPPTITPTPPPVLTCATVDAAWGQDWVLVLEALAALQAQGATCGAEPLASKQYAAHFNYAAALEAQGNREDAVIHYEAAYTIDPGRAEAIEALARLGQLPDPTPVACENSTPPPDLETAEIPDLTQFVTITNQTIALNGEPFGIRGVNYYPRHAPWDRFLEEAEPAEMATELDLIQGAGFNTIRIFLRYDALFTCEPELAIPNPVGFARLDTLLQLAEERDLRVMVTLNDLPDLRFRPLYTDWERYDAQTVYIVRRYRHQHSIIAWDLRNEGDLDYGARTGDSAKFSQDVVMAWLAHSSALVREQDPYHLITAGWWGDPAATSPYVDFLSFHHWSNADELQARIEAYQESATKPLVLQEVGYHSWAEAPADARTEEAQAELLGAVVNVAEVQGLAGWMIWSAFDYVPEPGQPPNYEHFFGIWRVDGTPKTGLDILQLNE